jgi:hypothetical protein
MGSGWSARAKSKHWAAELFAAKSKRLAVVSRRQDRASEAGH